MKPEPIIPKQPLRLRTQPSVKRVRGGISWGAVVLVVLAMAGTLITLQVQSRLLVKPSTPEGGAQTAFEKVPPVLLVEGAATPPTPARRAATVPAEELAAMEAAERAMSAAQEDIETPAAAGESLNPQGQPAETPEETLLVLRSPEATREVHVQKDRQCLELAIREKGWAQYRLCLQKSLIPAVAGAATNRGSQRYDVVWAEPILYRALLRWRVLGWLPESVIQQHVTDTYSGAVLIWLLDHPAAMEEFLLTIRSEDDPSKVLKFLIDAWSLEEKRFEKYFSLALACAVVFDREVAIPNRVGTSAEQEEESVIDPLKRFRWYVEKNEAGRLLVPVHRQTARDLVWVVGAPVAVSELEWALSKLSYRRRNWGDAYGRVEYLMERAVNGENPYDEYSFEQILKHGGICGDRAYFCVHTARANGIPAMIIGGETDAGGHAWVGMKIDDDAWTTGIGRVGGSAKGMADNPQTGRGITEQEILGWNDRYHQSEAHTLAVHRHLWLANLFAEVGDHSNNAVAVRLAHQLGKSFLEAWEALHVLLKRETTLEGEPPKPKNLDDWKDFVAGMRREFRENPRVADLANQAEMEYVLPYLEGSEAKLRLARERRRIEKHSGEQADLLAESVKRQATLALQRGDGDSKREISRLYDRALRDYGGNVTSFRMMANDYFNLVQHDRELALKAVRDIELAYKRVQETGTTEFFRAGTEAGLARMIADFYRKVGEEDRAKLIEKRHETLERRAKRSAL